MPVAVAYLSGNTLSYEPGIFKRGTIGFNLSTSLQGNYNWWNAVDQDANKLLIYSDTFSTSATSEANAIPSAWATTDLTDASLLGVINSVPELIGQPKFSDVKAALTWLQGRGIYFIVKDGYENIVTDSLVFNLDLGWYSSYAGSGNTVKDISSTGLNGTLYNSPAFNSSNGGGLYFDGTDDYGSFGSLPLNSPLSFTNGNFSLEHWIHPTQIQSGSYFGLQNMIIMKGPASTYNYATQVSSATGLRFYHRDLNESLSNNTFTVPNLLNKTTHVVFVINSAGTQISLYLNGVFYATQNLTGNPITPYANDPLLFGGYFTQQYTNFIGTIYQLRIYGKALSADEIWQNYNVGAARYGTSGFVTSGLKLFLDASNQASYPGSGTVWDDISGDERNATLTNGPTFSSPNGIQFDGTDDYANFNGVSTQTVCIFAKLDVEGQARGLVCTSVTGDGALRADGQSFRGAPNGGDGNDFQFGYPSRFMINGVDNLTTGLDGAFVVPNGKNILQPFYVGAIGNPRSLSTISHTFMGRVLDGTVYKVLLYNRQLSQDELLQNYYQGDIVVDNLLFMFDAGNVVSYEGAGTTTYSLINSTTGTLNNGVGFNSANGGYFTFDGTDDNINIGTVGGYSNQLTCESWFRTTSSATWKNMICGPGGDIIYTVNGNKINFGSQGSNPIPHDNLSNTIVNTGAWFHACVTYNGATVNIYINGVLDATYSETGSQTPGNLRIGSNDAGNSEFFSGDLPIVRLYNRALTQAEVIQNFNAQKARFGR